MPSRVKKARSAAPARPGVRPASQGPGPANPGPRSAHQAPAAAQPPAGSPAGPGPAGSAAGGRPQGAHTTSRRALKNWRVRSRLLLLITIPTLTAVVLGGTYIASSVQNALVYQRVETLANLSGAVTGLAAHLDRKSVV